MTDDILTAPAVELAAGIRRKELSPVELLEHCLDRIARVDPGINSIVALDADGALVAAQAAEKAVADADDPWSLPPFLGVPTAIKDLHLTKGLRTTFGCRAFADFVPDFDDEAVRRIREAGFVIVGKTNVPEFGTLPTCETELLGPCRNPWDPGRVAGGSSGGAAAAVATGLFSVAHASDGAGSIRIPASNCGLFGLKPARGRVSNGPLIGDMGTALSVQGPISRHVVDAAAMLDAMSGYAVGDPHWAPAPAVPFATAATEDPPRLRVGLVDEWPLATFDAEVLAALHAAAKLLEDLGHLVEPLELPFEASMRAEYEVVWAAGPAGLPIPPDAMEPLNRQLAERGHSYSAGRHVQAIMALQLWSRQLVEICMPFDVVLSPTIAQPPMALGLIPGLDVDEMFDRMADYVGLTPLANLTGQPAVSLPLGWSGDGLPLGVMVTGRPADELTLLRLSGQVQRAADWSHRLPPAAA